MNDQPLKIKGYYLHYKNKPYKLLGIVRHSETTEEMVHYKALYTSKDFGKKTEWVRPKEMFFENITLDGKEVPRFRFIGMTSADLKTATNESKRAEKETKLATKAAKIAEKEAKRAAKKVKSTKVEQPIPETNEEQKVKTD